MQRAYCRDEFPRCDLPRTTDRMPEPARQSGRPRLRFAAPRPPFNGRGHGGRRILLAAGPDDDPRQPAVEAWAGLGPRRVRRARAFAACRLPSRRNTRGSGAGLGPPAGAPRVLARSGGNATTTPEPGGAATSVSTPAAARARTAARGTPGHLAPRPRARALRARGGPRAPLPNTAVEPHPNLPASLEAAAGDIRPAASAPSISWVHLSRLSVPIANTSDSSSPEPRTSASTPSTVAFGSATTRLPASSRQPKRSSTTALNTLAASRGPPVPGPPSASARNRSSTKRPDASQNNLARTACRARGARCDAAVAAPRAWSAAPTRSQAYPLPTAPNGQLRSCKQ